MISQFHGSILEVKSCMGTWLARKKRERSLTTQKKPMACSPSLWVIIN